MNVHPLIASAMAALDDVDTVPAVQQIAVEVIVAAVTERLVAPSTTAVGLVWQWMKRNPDHNLWAMGVGAIPNKDVRADAIDVLRRGDAGVELTNAALGLLGGDGHAPFIDDDVLMEIVERCSREHIGGVFLMLREVHRARGVAPAILCAIRDRWAASDSAVMREHAVAVMFEMPELDSIFVETMLRDSHADVRSAVVQRVGLRDVRLRPMLSLMEARLLVETHPHVRAALLHAQAVIEEETVAVSHER